MHIIFLFAAIFFTVILFYPRGILSTCTLEDTSGYDVSANYFATHQVLNETEKLEDFKTKAKERSWNNRYTKYLWPALEWSFQDMQGEIITSEIQGMSNGSVDLNHVEWLYHKQKTGGVRMLESDHGNCEYYLYNDNSGYQVGEETIQGPSTQALIDAGTNEESLYFEYWLQQDGCLLDHVWYYTNSVPYFKFYYKPYDDEGTDICNGDSKIFELKFIAPNSTVCDQAHVAVYDSSVPVATVGTEEDAKCIKKSTNTIDISKINRGELVHLFFYFDFFRNELKIYINGEKTVVEGFTPTDLVFPTTNEYGNQLMFGRMPVQHYNGQLNSRAYGGNLFYFAAGKAALDSVEIDGYYHAGPPNNPPFAHSQEIWTTYGEYVDIELTAEDVEDDPLKIEILDEPLLNSSNFKNITDGTGGAMTVSINITDSENPLVTNDTLLFSFQAQETDNSDGTTLLKSLETTVQIHFLEPPEINMPTYIEKYDFETLNITVNGSHPNVLPDKLDNVVIDILECTNLNELEIITSNGKVLSCGDDPSLLGNNNQFVLKPSYINENHEAQVYMNITAFHSLDPSYLVSHLFEIWILNSLSLNSVNFTGFISTVDFEQHIQVSLDFTDKMRDYAIESDIVYCAIATSEIVTLNLTNECTTGGPYLKQTLIFDLFRKYTI